LFSVMDRVSNVPEKKKISCEQRGEADLLDTGSQHDLDSITPGVVGEDRGARVA